MSEVANAMEKESRQRGRGCAGRVAVSQPCGLLGKCSRQKVQQELTSRWAPAWSTPGTARR